MAPDLTAAQLRHAHVKGLKWSHIGLMQKGGYWAPFKPSGSKQGKRTKRISRNHEALRLLAVHFGQKKENWTFRGFWKTMEALFVAEKVGETQKHSNGGHLKGSSRLRRLPLPFQMQSILKFLLKIHTGESVSAAVRGKLSDNIPNSILYCASRKDFHIF